MPIGKVIILAGGGGTRLPHSARDIPKALVPVGGKPILAHILDGLLASGLSLSIRLALGFRADQTITFVREHGYPCEYVIEPEPLGTGGAVKFASHDLDVPFMVLNGDTLADFDYPAIVRAHQPGTALLVSYWRDDNRDYGFLTLAGNQITEFREKPADPQPGFVSAGCSILEPEHVHTVPRASFMLETVVYPELARSGRLKTIRHGGFFEDMGTEARLATLRERFGR